MIDLLNISLAINLVQFVSNHLNESQYSLTLIFLVLITCIWISLFDGFELFLKTLKSHFKPFLDGPNAVELCNQKLVDDRVIKDKLPLFYFVFLSFYFHLS